MKRLPLTAATMLLAGTAGFAGTAHAQYYTGSAFGDGVASTYGYGATPPRTYPWSQPAYQNYNYGVQQVFVQPYRAYQPAYGRSHFYVPAPVYRYTPIVIPAPINTRLNRW